MKLLLHTKSRSCQFLLAVLVCLLGGNLAVAQVEVNVKLNPGETAWQGFLQNPLPDAPLVQRYAVLRQLEQTRRAQEAGTFKQADPDLSRIFTLQFVGENTSAILSSLRNTGVFEFVEENFTRKVHALTGTPPNDDSVAAQWHHPYIRTFDAWDMTRGSANVKVGVIDTGLDFNHPEYEGQIAINLPEDLNGNGTFEPWSNTETQNGRTGDFDGIDNDGNGYVDDVVGYDFTDQPRSPFGGDYLEADPDPTDDNSHGTIVSGIIHAKADNGFGGTGVAPACKLVVLRAFAANGSGEDDDIARAIIYAADNDIRILNFSFGDIYPSKIMHEAIKYAYSRGVIMVSSAGNGTGDELHYPSGFNEVISVSATSYDPATGREFLWPLSSYGVTVDLSAPGSGILCPTILDTATNGEVTAFGRYSGTSAAAPMVAGTAALLMSYRGNFTPQQMRGILTTSTDDVSDPGWDHFTGAGRLNMVKALQSVGAAQVQIVTPENDTGSPRDTVYLLGTILDPEFEQYHIEYQEGLEDVNPWLPISVEQRRQLKNDTLGMWDLTGIPEGEYTLRVRVDRTNGFTSEDRIRFIRDKSPPEVDLRLAAPAWDNEQRKLLVIFRDNDQGTHVLNYRPLGSNGPFRTITFDRTTRNGEFLLGSDRVPSGTYELFIRATNLAGLTADSRVDTVVFESKFVNRAGFRRIAPTLPMGRFLPGNFDINKNGLADVVVSEYGDQLEFGRLKFYEFNGIFFQAVDSITISPVLIPKDITDTDGDGLLELLCSVNDSTYILEQETPFVFPKNVIYSNLGNELYSANFSDTDADGQEELVMKDFEDYFVFEGGGANFTQAAILEDISPNYIGSTAPRSITGDFDNDVRPETVFGDFDGDILVYEHGGGNTYTNRLVDTTNLIKSATYITKGDFDGDGIPEFFVAAHASSLRNADFEYDVAHWRLRIFKATGDNQYEVIWEDYLYDIDTDPFNAATAGNLDDDPADELLFTTFPRTYLIDFDGNEMQMAWFRFGDLATHHIIMDLNGNGINEIGIGRGDTTFFWEKDVAYTGPQVVTSVQGRVLGPDRAEITWQASPNATDYGMVHIKDPFSGNTTGPLFPTAATSIIDSSLENGSEYLFFVVARNQMLTPNESPPGTFVVLRPHENNRVDSVVAVSPKQLTVYFSQPVIDRDTDKPLFLLNGTHTPSSIIQAGNPGRKLILGFDQLIPEGMNTLRIDPDFLDAERGILNPADSLQNFRYEPAEDDYLFLTKWEIAGDKEAILFMNYPLDEASALDTANYEISPVGSIRSVAFASEDMDAVRITVNKARFGALGYPISITVTPEVCAINQVCFQENEGNTATFSAFKQDLSEVFVYPNPVRNHDQFDGLRFANLTQIANIRVMSVSGRMVTKLEETDGDGGLEWDMRDRDGRRIKPGIYIYHVTADGVDDFIGKFSVVE